ncbi:GNAT family N-acetyltransferase [Vibrio aestuarianus]|uniref:Histone acetyltransferase n=1 Tax=Vibrio aestuarianus TaxID=28171 RepID=A0ABM9FJ79_9VIBR|nr:GNAT family N-acetyltransferase [Vibrio aestuarianus]MDE1210389.1 GNAT family N-acetyltransferase [Vibrio aestuarianus]MDE1229415.1 GNAT family N-acetyltransferase [Vibrio aestuarianus]MDE1229993.1 GNAT family N-acetyltransferase [Vibrio aestuarianus]MDE1258733.1 GNAT family N-acetyltransferase [Vibrio aestuarianus]MDE1270471.1 GNAT family N-acetyltransferase [Vibrio aestuarianus]
MEIKVAEYCDYERIAQLHAQSWRTHYQGILGKEYLDNDVLEDRLLIWQTRLINPPFNQHVLLIEEGGLLCGFICAFGNHDFEKGSIIESLHIDENYRGRGIGRKLIQEMVSWINHYFPNSGVYLEVMADNKQAIDFYDYLESQPKSERLWHSPCGNDIKEWVYSWKSPNDLLTAVSA